MQQDVARGVARRCRVWLREAPGWAAADPGGTIEDLRRWPDGTAPPSAPASVAAWGLRVVWGGHMDVGVLGARFEPHDEPVLRVVVTTAGAGTSGESPFDDTVVGLPAEYARGVLTGALREANAIGPGTVSFAWAAAHPSESSERAFRVLAIGVVRLLALPDGGAVPVALLPWFGGPD